MKTILSNNKLDNLVIFSVVGHPNEFNKTLLNLAKKGIELDCTLILADSRIITQKQRNFIFAMIGEICYQEHGDRNIFKDFEYGKLKQQFKGVAELDTFSTSNCSMTLANRFINYIIGYMLMNDYNVHKWIVDFDYKFSQEHLYIMLMNGQCFITGKKINIHLHHYDALGSGADRTKWQYHVGKRIMLLHAIEHQLEHCQYDYMLDKNYIDPKTLPVIDEAMAKAIANGTFKKYLRKVYNSV